MVAQFCPILCVGILIKGDKLMGMFDSFIVEIEGNPVELQTKRFDSVLCSYRIGDVVGGAPGGVQVYLDKVGLDASGKPVYPEEKIVSRWTVLLALAHGLFVDYQVVAGELESEEALRCLRELREKWEDSARLLNRLILALSEKQAQIARLQSCINHASSAIKEARRLRAGDDEHRFFPIRREYTERLQRGDEPLDVVEWVLSEDWPELFACRGPDDLNPLAEYLL
jgi:hypothetical protein